VEDVSTYSNDCSVISCTVLVEYGQVESVCGDFNTVCVLAGAMHAPLPPDANRGPIHR
jgi:hypothetical protein